jgi:glycosyltransferase 2 family protein
VIARPAKLAIALLQTALTAAMLVLSIGVLDQAEFRSRLVEASPVWVAAGCALLFVQQWVAASRWRAIAGDLQLAPNSFAFFLVWHGIGTTAGQLLPSTVGGDAIRAFALLKPGQIAPAIRSVLTDRLVGMIVLAFLVAVGFALGPSAYIDNYAMLAALSLAAAGITAAALLIAFSVQLTRRGPLLRAIGRIGADLKIAAVGKNGGFVLLQSLVIHLLSIGAFIAFAQAVGIPVPDPIVLGSVVCSALLASMLPVSVGGWGLREGFMVVASSAMGISAEAATGMSVLFGATILVASAGVAAAGAVSLAWLRLAKQTSRSAGG